MLFSVKLPWIRRPPGYRDHTLKVPWAVDLDRFKCTVLVRCTYIMFHDCQRSVCYSYWTTIKASTRLPSEEGKFECVSTNPTCRSRNMFLRSFEIAVVFLLVLCGIAKCDQHGQRGRPRTQYTTEEFVDSVCSPPLKGVPRVEPVLCTLDRVSEIVYCALEQLLRVEVVNCTGVDIRNQPGKYVFCLAVLHRAFHTFREVLKDAQRKRVIYPNCTSPSVFELARRTAQQCDLFQPKFIHAHPELCNTTMRKASRRIGPFLGFGYIEASVVARISLTVLSRPGESVFRRTSAIEPGCWEPDIVRTVQLYRRKDVWDVSDSCLDVLRVVLAKTYALAMSHLTNPTRFKACFSSPFAFAVPGKTRLGYALCVAAWLKHRILLLVNIPRWISRFRSVAKRRRYKAVTPSKSESHLSHVSCKNLRGTAKDVREALLTLLRLVMIARTQHHGFQLVNVLEMSFLSNYFPCFVRQIV